MKVCALKLPDARRVALALPGGTGTRTPSAAQEWSSGTVRVVSRAIGSLVRSACYER